MKKSICIIASVLLFAACANENSTLDMKGMFSPNGETIDARFEQSLAYNATRGEIRIDMQADDYTIYVCTDSHITRKTHRNLDYFVAQYRAAAAPKLALHLGDVIDAQKNFPCADSILHFEGQTIADTLFVTPGNHDIYFKQWPIYREFFKSSVYWFDTRNGAKKLDLFICLDSAEGELGVKQMNWLRSLLEAKSKEGYRRIIVFSHTHLWKLDASQGHTSNMALEATYEFTSLLSQYGVEYYWCGHQHARQVVRFKGVTYMVLNATKDSESGQSYMIAHMGENVSYDYIDFPKE
jgi:predicted phosphodiesterase